MQVGRLSIVTQVNDEAEKSAIFEADMKLESDSAFLRYYDGGSLVGLWLKNNELTIERRGDYNLFLRLKENEILESSLGFGSSSGRIFAETHALDYSITKTSLLLSVKYALCFDGGEKQEMKIRLIAKVTTEEK